jgi:hypothetical protein
VQIVNGSTSMHPPDRRPSAGSPRRRVLALVRRATEPVPGVGRWAVWAAHLIALVSVPSGLWRIALGAGVPMGFTGDLARVYAAPGWITPYVIALTLLSEAAALLSFGLIARWGEAVPSRAPLIGRRRLPAGLVTSVSAVATIALVLIAVPTVAVWNGPDNMGDPDAPQGLSGVVMTAAYAPMLAWPPLLAALTVAYWLRRRRA